jgi:hypothetical protein
MSAVKGKGETKIKRRPGRPATGKDPTFTLRMPQALRKEAQQIADAEGLTLAKAVLKVFEVGLATLKKKKG